MFRTRRHALTMIEVIALLVIFTVAALWFLSPRRRGCGGVSRRLVCAANLKGIGTSCLIYANDNAGSWPVPAFDETWAPGVDYTVRAGSGEGSVRSPNRLQESVGGPGGARQLSVTRSFWMLVRSGDAVTSQFICPTAGDLGDLRNSGAEISPYYDFPSPESIHYGFQVPFGPPCTRAMDGSDNRLPVAADRGPYATPDVGVPPNDVAFASSESQSRPDAHRAWRKYNSPDHGSELGGEGQNVLFADGHVSFSRTPIVGIDRDNIYTIASDVESPWSVTAGESPWKRSANPRAHADCSKELPGKDSVIFP